MAFYEQAGWSAPGRQPSWEQPAPPSRSGATSASVRDEPSAFSSQYEEIERAQDNLMKSGKWFAGAPGRRDSLPPMRPYQEIGQSMSGSSSRTHSVSEYDGHRSNSAAGLQGFYAAQRFQQPRQNDAEQMLQAKRRMAAQRERELRNYHQEQQYNRTSTGVKTVERPASPNNEEDRRELIARQHRALYGNESSLYSPDGSAPRQSQDARVSGSISDRQASPLAFDPFGMKGQSNVDSVVQMPPREQTAAGAAPERRSSKSPPTSNTVSSSSPNNSPALGQGTKGSAATSSVAPIGTRPAQAPVTKRSATPNERSASAASNPALANSTPSLGGWGSSSGVWGPQKNTLGVQASVWG